MQTALQMNARDSRAKLLFDPFDRLTRVFLLSFWCLCFLSFVVSEALMTALSPHPNAPVLSADAHPSTLEVKHGETLWCQVSDQNLHKLTKYTM